MGLLIGTGIAVGVWELFKISLISVLVIFGLSSCIYAAVQRHRNNLRMYGKSYARSFQLDSFQPDLLEAPFRLSQNRNIWELHNKKGNAIGIIPAEHTEWVAERQNVFKDIAVEPDGTATITVYYANK